MRKQKTLISLLRGLVDLVSEEAARNQEFATKLEDLLVPLPEKPTKVKRPSANNQMIPLPDIYAERNAKGDTEFRLWLRDQPVVVLHGLIRQHDFDATHRTRKWKESEKLSAFIAEQLESRFERGSSFLRSTDTADQR